MSRGEPHTKGVLFLQNLIFRDDYFSSSTSVPWQPCAITRWGPLSHQLSAAVTLGRSRQPKDVRSHSPPSRMTLCQGPSVKWFDRPFPPKKSRQQFFSSDNTTSSLRLSENCGMGNSWFLLISFPSRQVGLWHILTQSAIVLTVAAPSPWIWEAFLHRCWAGRALLHCVSSSYSQRNRVFKDHQVQVQSCRLRKVSVGLFCIIFPHNKIYFLSGVVD